MAKQKANKLDEASVDTNVEEVSVPSETKSEWPEVGQTGKFHAVKHGDGYVVYNPAGQRATGIVDKIKADDIVRANNQAAHIKG
jgi:hypothetical protein